MDHKVWDWLTHANSVSYSDPIVRSVSPRDFIFRNVTVDDVFCCLG